MPGITESRPRDAKRDERAGEALERLFVEMRATFGTYSNVRLAQAFVVATRNETASRADVAAVTKAESSTNAYDMGALARYGRGGKRGLRLLTESPDPLEPRAYVYRTTPKGKAALSRLMAAIGPRPSSRAGV